MKKTYNIHEAKTNLSKIIGMVEDGETVYLAKAGKIVAELKASKGSGHRMTLGTHKKFNIPHDWDSQETNKEIEKLFYGNSKK